MIWLVDSTLLFECFVLSVLMGALMADYLDPLVRRIER